MFKRKKLPQHEIIHDYRTDKPKTRFWPIIFLTIAMFVCLGILTVGAVEPAAADTLGQHSQTITHTASLIQPLENHHQQLLAIKQQAGANYESSHSLFINICLGLAYLLMISVVFFSIKLEEEHQLVQEKNTQHNS